MPQTRSGRTTYTEPEAEPMEEKTVDRPPIVYRHWSHKVVDQWVKSFRKREWMWTDGPPEDDDEVDERGPATGEVAIGKVKRAWMNLIQYGTYFRFFCVVYSARDPDTRYRTQLPVEIIFKPGSKGIKCNDWWCGNEIQLKNVLRKIKENRVSIIIQNVQVFFNDNPTQAEEEIKQTAHDQLRKYHASDRMHNRNFYHRSRELEESGRSAKEMPNPFIRIEGERSWLEEFIKENIENHYQLLPFKTYVDAKSPAGFQTITLGAGFMAPKKFYVYVKDWIKKPGQLLYKIQLKFGFQIDAAAQRVSQRIYYGFITLNVFNPNTNEWDCLFQYNKDLQTHTLTLVDLDDFINVTSKLIGNPWRALNLPHPWVRTNMTDNPQQYLVQP